ncbi:hypothetical protein JWG42_01685 [Desulfoprunum benzoelyticum]|uniref:Uncharacterized protein n=1 Tax=Desulfoprunum benzoelyticum TaxID=1506996 RepID=A0A840URY0_9BACT|nr:hypothetical protein [Desulfoprunum benzoelyticum]MBB5348977.1 hypothetical protein [Desulfoprunum benzoelyticum]MBM9528862.1 hypothetical protein [Desulfoprunum benzoelyticum]
MSFFDAIDRLKKTDSTSNHGKSDQPEPEKAHQRAPKEGDECQGEEEIAVSHNITPATGPKKSTDQATKRNRKPERLSFLRPCPICKGRLFIYGSRGGFFCSNCTPHIEGQPVEATGPDRLQSNQGVDSTLPLGFTPQASTRSLGENPENFKAAWPWIKVNMQDLLKAGWTRAALVRRGKLRYPCGNWGVAWFSVWKIEGLVIEIGRNGKIVFTFESCGRKITQAAYP